MRSPHPHRNRIAVRVPLCWDSCQRQTRRRHSKPSPSGISAVGIGGIISAIVFLQRPVRPSPSLSLAASAALVSLRPLSSSTSGQTIAVGVHERIHSCRLRVARNQVNQWPVLAVNGPTRAISIVFGPAEAATHWRKIGMMRVSRSAGWNKQSGLSGAVANRGDVVLP